MNKIDFKNLISECVREVDMEEQHSSHKSLKSKIKSLIAESLEEIKYKDEEGLAEIVEALEKSVKSKFKDATVMYDDSKNITIDCGIPHFFRISPQSIDVFHVLYYKDRTDRTKKLNLSTEAMKEFVNEMLKTKDLNYVKKEFNKAAENNKEKESKTENPTHHKFVKKEVNDTKNDEKNYNEPMVKEKTDLPVNNPYKDATKFKRQNENPLKGTKAPYTYPKQKNKDITIKPKKTTKFKK
jgi:hypothetical protein